jgi:hypothetical protein
VHIAPACAGSREGSDHFESNLMYRRQQKKETLTQFMYAQNNESQSDNLSN